MRLRHLIEAEVTRDDGTVVRGVKFVEHSTLWDHLVKIGEPEWTDPATGRTYRLATSAEQAPKSLDLAIDSLIVALDGVDEARGIIGPGRNVRGLVLAAQAVVDAYDRERAS